MYEDFSDILDEFSIPLLVTLPDSEHPAGHTEHGAWVPDVVPPTEVNEPLTPPSKTASYSAQEQFNEGGQTLSYDALWYSKLDVPNGTTVRINKDHGRTFTVSNRQDYSDYSNVTVYELKGASNHVR